MQDHSLVIAAFEILETITCLSRRANINFIITFFQLPTEFKMFNVKMTNWQVKTPKVLACTTYGYCNLQYCVL